MSSRRSRAWMRSVCSRARDRRPFTPIGGKKARFELLVEDDAADKPGVVRRWRPSRIPPRSHSILARMDQLVNCHHQSHKNDADSPKRIVKRTVITVFKNDFQRIYLV